ncbi:hypothetical protein [Paraburkholderia sp. LEh10]|uniref:hypothetical protein n=1 Tax=Paraburkholderia sp. LEh10 TaxID=2821353 RepID=UPI001FD74A0E|nr:hypothetical protein [Paraburkholderia sp. LEh10]
MIAPLRSRSLQRIDGIRRATLATQRFHLNVMINFLLDLISNLIILAVMLAACCVINWMKPDAKANGYLAFVVFVALALLFDAALTFLVFADSQARYGRFSTTGAFVARLAAYAAASAIAICLARVRSRKPAEASNKPPVIGTSPYTDSRLPM